MSSPSAAACIGLEHLIIFEGEVSKDQPVPVASIVKYLVKRDQNGCHHGKYERLLNTSPAETNEQFPGDLAAIQRIDRQQIDNSPEHRYDKNVVKKQGYSLIGDVYQEREGNIIKYSNDNKFIAISRGDQNAQNDSNQQESGSRSGERDENLAPSRSAGGARVAAGIVRGQATHPVKRDPWMMAECPNHDRVAEFMPHNADEYGYYPNQQLGKLSVFIQAKECRQQPEHRMNADRYPEKRKMDFSRRWRWLLK